METEQPSDRALEDELAQSIAFLLESEPTVIPEDIDNLLMRYQMHVQLCSDRPIKQLIKEAIELQGCFEPVELPSELTET